MTLDFSSHRCTRLACIVMTLAIPSAQADDRLGPIRAAAPITATPTTQVTPATPASPITISPAPSATTSHNGQLQSLQLRITPTAGLVPPVPALTPPQPESLHFPSPERDRGHASIEVQWTPTELQHRPLLFEDVTLERQGRHAGLLQPLASSAHFFGRVPILPYLRGDEPATSRVSPLGTPRPGTPGYPVTRPSLQPSLRGSVYQAGATVGGVFIVP